MSVPSYNNTDESITFVSIGQKIHNIKSEQIKQKYTILNSIANNCVTQEMMDNPYYEKLISKKDQCYFKMNPKKNLYETKTIVFNKNFQRNLSNATNIDIYNYYSRKYSMNYDLIMQVKDKNLNRYEHFLIMHKEILKSYIFLHFITMIFICLILIGLLYFVNLSIDGIILFMSLILSAPFLYSIFSVNKNKKDNINDLNFFFFGNLITYLFFFILIIIFITIFIYTNELFYVIFYLPLFIISCLIDIIISIIYNKKLSTINCYYIKLNKPDKYQFYADIILNEY